MMISCSCTNFKICKLVKIWSRFVLSLSGRSFVQGGDLRRDKVVGRVGLRAQMEIYHARRSRDYKFAH